MVEGGGFSNFTTKLGHEIKLYKGKQAPPTLKLLNLGDKDCKKIVDIMWHETIPNILHCMWQLNNEGI